MYLFILKSPLYSYCPLLRQSTYRKATFSELGTDHKVLYTHTHTLKWSPEGPKTLLSAGQSEDTLWFLSNTTVLILFTFHYPSMSPTGSAYGCAVGRVISPRKWQQMILPGNGLLQRTASHSVCKTQRDAWLIFLFVVPLPLYVENVGFYGLKLVGLNT